jgi:hypothetical protein
MEPLPTPVLLLGTFDAGTTTSWLCQAFNPFPLFSTTVETTRRKKRGGIGLEHAGGADFERGRTRLHLS